MKYFIDGDQIAVVNDDFVDLQESNAIFIPKDSKTGKRILKGGIEGLDAFEKRG